VKHGDLSPDSTGADQLSEQYNNSLNIQDSAHPSGFVGKFRSSLKKKISIKGVSGLVKTPTRTGTRRTEDGDGDKERTEEPEDKGLERSPNLERSDNVDELEGEVVEKYQGEEQVLEETVESFTQVAEESIEIKKKKKKKRRPREEEVEQQEIEMVESTPVKSEAGKKLPDFAESPVVTEEISYEVMTEEQSGGKVKKTKRRTHKKRTQQEEDDEQVY